jgi:hypothetical protein
MFIYLAVGENYVESVEPALSNHGAYALFFVICSLLGLFFITSLFLQVFTDAYSSTKGVLTPQQYRRWAALAVTYALYTHSTRVEKHQSIRRSHWLQSAPEMSSLMLQQVVLQQGNNQESSQRAQAWLQRAFAQLAQVLSLLDGIEDENEDLDVKEYYKHEIAALATLCCELQCSRQIARMKVKGWVTDFNSDKCDADGCFEGRKEMELSQALVRLGLCENSESEDEVIRVLLGARDL